MDTRSTALVPPPPPTSCYNPLTHLTLLVIRTDRYLLLLLLLHLTLLVLLAGNKVSEYKSTLQYQTRCLAVFHDNKGFAEGSIEGRVALEYFDELGYKKMDKSECYPLPSSSSSTQLVSLFSTCASDQRPANAKSFAFKCHRQNDKDIFAVNALHFHPHNTFLSAGSDGCICVWDKEARHRITNFEAYAKQCPVADAKFSPMGNILVYALSYDWSRGVEGNDPKVTPPPLLLLHVLTCACLSWGTTFSSTTCSLWKCSPRRSLRVRRSSVTATHSTSSRSNSVEVGGGEGGV
eukprot:scaffold13193_cov189-Ochromonas_danica.AAC.1